MNVDLHRLYFTQSLIGAVPNDGLYYKFPVNNTIPSGHRLTMLNFKERICKSAVLQGQVELEGETNPSESRTDESTPQLLIFDSLDT